MSQAPDSMTPVPEAPAPELSSLPSSSRERKKGGVVLTIPGMASESWERWMFFGDHEPTLLPLNATMPPQSDHLLAIPSSLLFSWPLWISSEGESLELVRLELSGRHLLKRGMEDSLQLLPILHHQERQLVLAVAVEEPFPSQAMPPDWKNSSRFELPARLLGGSLSHDLMLWEEWGALQMAFYRDRNPVWFCGVRPGEVSGVTRRIALRLLAEGVLDRFPASIRIGRISGEIALRCAEELRHAFPGAEIASEPLSSESGGTVPILRPDSFDLPPSEAREARRRLTRRQRFFSMATAGALLYLLLLLWGAGDLLIRQTALKHLRQQIAHIESPALDAQNASARWHSLRPAIDPSTFALDLLAAVAVPTAGGKVRLTNFSMEQGHLHISGEATDVTQAFNFIEQLKKNPLLQEYDWTSSQPQLAGKNSVKFDMEGIRPDASHETSGS